MRKFRSVARRATVTGVTTPQAHPGQAPVVECIDCRALPAKVDVEADLAANPDAVRVRLIRSGIDYRPKTPRAIVDGCGPRTPRCDHHKRAQKRAQRVTARATHKERRFGLTAELQLILWTLQGAQCPCGAKKAPTVPPGVALDHDHQYAAQHCDHPVADGCLDCLLGYLCLTCNRDIIGRFTGHGRRKGGRNYVLAALKGLVAFMEHPPIELLRAHIAATERPAWDGQTFEPAPDVVDVPVTRKDTAA